MRKTSLSTREAAARSACAAIIAALVLVSLPSLAAEPEETAPAVPTLMTEPARCYWIASRHPDDNGLGLPVGLAVDLCSSTKDAMQTLKCYADASTLQLTVGLAVELCRSSRGDD